MNLLKGTNVIYAVCINSDPAYILDRVKHNNHQDICLLESVSDPFEVNFLKLSVKKPEYGEQVYNLVVF